MKQVEGGKIKERFDSPEKVTNEEIKELKKMEGMDDTKLAEYIGKDHLKGLKVNLEKEMSGYIDRKGIQHKGHYSTESIKVIGAFNNIINRLDNMIDKLKGQENPDQAPTAPQGVDAQSPKPADGEGKKVGLDTAVQQPPKVETPVEPKSINLPEQTDDTGDRSFTQSETGEGDNKKDTFLIDLNTGKLPDNFPASISPDKKSLLFNFPCTITSEGVTKTKPGFTCEIDPGDKLKVTVDGNKISLTSENDGGEVIIEKLNK